MNPAVTLANAVVGRMPWKKLPGYWAAQMLGAFVASAVVYGVYYGKNIKSMQAVVVDGVVLTWFHILFTK